MRKIDLSGLWRYETDENDTGAVNQIYNRPLANSGFKIPGSACDNKIGTPCKPFDALTSESARSLVPRYDYIGALWLQRDIETEDLTGKYVTLFLERVNIASDLWIDGEKVGRQIIALSTPHTYDVSRFLTAGTHTITLRICNSNLLNIDKMASGYSPDTQSIWLGIIGKTELRIEEKRHISSVQIFPEEKSARVKVTVASDCAYPKDRLTAKLTLTAAAPDGKELKKLKQTVTLFNRKQTVYIDYPMGRNIRYWSEFDPAMYTMTVNMECEGVADEKTAAFGMRTIFVKNKQFMLNRRALSLRGTTDCAINPLTGYPPMDLEHWTAVMRTVKEYGFNHIRFHAWCPCEAAFEAADAAGVYVLAEMPLWLNHDVCALETGDDPIHRAYYTQEALNISRAYGNHPSFIMFSNGNELMGDFELLEDITTQIKALDNRRLYTMTSNFDHPMTPAEDYLCAFEAYGNRVRLQVFHDVVSEHTMIKYDEAVKDTPAPVVSFEVGQYCVYPQVNKTGDYTGNLAPLNFEAIKNDMIEKGVYEKLDKYIYASGAFAALMYKEDIEAALRTHGMGGFELLSLSDYTGQGTATVGLLDVFLNSKGIISPAEFRHFCSSVVPLFLAKRVFLNTETLDAEFDLYDYSENPIRRAEYHLQITDGKELLVDLKTRRSKVSIPLAFVKAPSMLTVTLSVNEHKNSWTIFVYPETDSYVLPTVHNMEEIRGVVEAGKAAVVIMTPENLKNPIDGLFKPVFWSPAYFKSNRACGLVIDSQHPIFKLFPTKATADFQWKHPIDKSVGADISALNADFSPIVEPVPSFFDNTPRSPLFEAKVKNARLLFCGFDLSADDTCSQALANAVASYVTSPDFTPSQELTIEDIEKLLS